MNLYLSEMLSVFYFFISNFEQIIVKIVNQEELKGLKNLLINYRNMSNEYI